MKTVAFAVALLPVAAFAQTAPSLSFSGNTYTLAVPYLEYGSGAGKQAFSANLTATTLGSSRRAQSLLRRMLTLLSLVGAM